MCYRVEGRPEPLLATEDRQAFKRAQGGTADLVIGASDSPALETSASQVEKLSHFAEFLVARV